VAGSAAIIALVHEVREPLEIVAVVVGSIQLRPETPSGGPAWLELHVSSRPVTTDLDLSRFWSKLDASNYNRNYLEWLTHFVNQGNYGRDPATGAIT